MKLVIDIDEELTEKDHFYTEKEKWSIVDAVQNGTPLPKGHGDLKDADAFERRCMFDSNIEDMQDVIYALRDFKPVIEADKAERSE